MHVIIPISLGGIFGALCRYYASLYIQSILPSSFPSATLIVNITGCLFIGFVIQAALMNPGFSNKIRLFLVTGFAGSYTTFSTFGYETLQLISNGDYTSAFLNIFLNNTVGLAAVYLGIIIAEKLYKSRVWINIFKPPYYREYN